jgi:hypothetical protein
MFPWLFVFLSPLRTMRELPVYEGVPDVETSGPLVESSP